MKNAEKRHSKVCKTADTKKFGTLSVGNDILLLLRTESKVKIFVCSVENTKNNTSIKASHSAI